MLIFAFKLLISPLLIASVTLAGRRWGAIVSGFLIGLPLTSGPISFILAYEQGTAFATQAAVGNLAGQISNCFFCLAYTLAARKGGWQFSSLFATATFALATVVLNLFSWTLWPAFGVLLAVIVVVGKLIPQQSVGLGAIPPPRWDFPARILSATTLVIVMTGIAKALGPQLSGLLSPFPAFSLVFAAFAHSQQGARSAASLLRGVVIGSGSYATFFLVVGAWLPHLGIAVTYLLASLLAIVVSGLFFVLTRRFDLRQAKPAAKPT